MMKPKKHLEEIRNLTFSNETIKIQKNDIVEYFVAKHNPSAYNSLYQEVKRFFILYIEEVDVESPSLYQSQNFCYRFREAGIYNVYCLNYPKMKQTVIVEQKNGLMSLNDIRCSETASQISVTARESFFMQSEDQQLSINNQSVEQEYNDISECLHLIKEGCPAFSIKSKFTELFKNENEPSNSQVLAQSAKKEEAKQLSSKRSPIDDFPSDLHHANQVSEDLFKVHQLNKLTPNNLFVLFTKLKQTYVKEDEDKVVQSFKTFDDLALYCKDKYNRPAPKSSFDNKAVINRALANINRRFE